MPPLAHEYFHGMNLLQDKMIVICINGPINVGKAMARRIAAAVRAIS